MNPAPLRLILSRGVLCRCPRCGVGKIYKGFYRLKSQCEHCSLFFLRDPIDVLSFMYMSTALLTGVGIFLLFLWKPENLFLGRLLMAAVALLIIVGTLPIRKGVAVALEYWVRERLEED